ncbi:spermidine synthase [Paraurantiacibacter namhicola]|uniref:spermine/spermidine synthase domain-containing protein n=1 Tax=Paraurantiacibacter namhicola TaxID=645517 RepID=UPI001F3DED2D|nr:spermidine synthase [Paraurantiacibacter namhicola]
MDIAQDRSIDGAGIAQASAPPESAQEDSGNVAVRLVLSAALMLFVELALIRWLGSNVIHLSYFSNFVLLGSFLGIGAGFLIARKDWSIWPWSLPLLTLLTIAVIRYPMSIQREGADIIYFTALEMSGPPAWLALPLIFLLVAVILAGPAELVGRCFAKLPALRAYRWDLIGSLTGIVAFSVLAFMHAPSLVWGLVAAALYVVLSEKRRRLVSIAWAIPLLVILFNESTDESISWTPYYKIQTLENENKTEGLLQIRANGVPHQVMAPADLRRALDYKIYFAPYLRRNPGELGDVLIIGAGSGSDLAIALQNGARSVDAVDIDPGIMQIGIDGNVDRPYQDPRVTRHIDDGRAFLEGTDKKYDFILFALPDSLTLVNGASQIRLESFLFTEEALVSVRDRLKPGGTFSMYNYYREDWLIDRLANTAATAFGHAPCVDTFDGAQAVITAGYSAADQNCAATWEPVSAPEDMVPANDNAPFVYFKGDNFPPMYIITLSLILAASFITVRTLGGPMKEMRPYADLFFMGAAFLLLQAKNIATFALLFGTTWFVNALVFGGVLLCVLAAVETTARFKTPPLKFLYVAIAASLAAAWAIPEEWLLAMPYIPRLVAATLIAFVPIYIANVAFSKRFRESGDTRSAFAVNLLGTILGGCLEYAALFTGYNNLLIVVGVLYLAAFIAVPKVRGHAVAAPA